MRLMTADVAELPLAAALLDAAGNVVAATPEWRGSGPGSTTYRVGAIRLVVAGDDSDADLVAVTAQLVAELRAVAATEGEPQRARRLAMLAAGIGLVAGCAEPRPGSTTEVLAFLDAAVAAVSTAPVTVTAHHPGSVPDAAMTALALKQIVVNARRHDDATAVALRVEPGPQFVLEWSGVGLPSPTGVATARHQAERQRWGLGYVRLAADALGAVALAPMAIAPRTVEAVLALDTAPRLRLPLAAIGDDGRVERASPAWDEETRLPPGSAVPVGLAQLVADARARPGSIAVDGPRRARRGLRRTWVAMPPQDAADRARDAIRGLIHEQDLWDAPEPYRTRVHALVQIVAVLLGDPMPRHTPDSFRMAFPAACAALGVATAPRFTPSGAAPDPALLAYLLWSLDAVPVESGNGVTLVVPEARRDDPVVRRLADATGTIVLTPQGERTQHPIAPTGTTM